MDRRCCDRRADPHCAALQQHRRLVASRTRTAHHHKRDPGARAVQLPAGRTRLGRPAMAVRSHPRRTRRSGRRRACVIGHGPRRSGCRGARRLVGATSRAHHRAVARVRDGDHGRGAHQRCRREQRCHLGARGRDRTVRHQPLARRRHRRGLGVAAALPALGEHGCRLRGWAPPARRCPAADPLPGRACERPSTARRGPRDQRCRGTRQPRGSWDLRIDPLGSVQPGRGAGPRELRLARLPRVVGAALRSRGGPPRPALDHLRRTPTASGL